jgi:antitoxin (DNA-binding transcriptional repressor) of toxin-antitoxin stability system
MAGRRRPVVTVLHRFLYSAGMPMLDSPRHLSITSAASRGVSALVTEAEDGGIVLERHGKPVAAVIPIGQLAALDEAAADLRDLALVLARVATDDGERVALDDVLSAFGVTRDQLASLPDEE